MTQPAVEALRRVAGKWRLRRRVGVFFAVCAGLLAALVAATVLALMQFVHAGNQAIDRWAPAAQTSQALLTDMINQETGVRGYALAASADFLQPFDQYSKQQMRDEARLRELVRGDPVLEQNLADFERMADQWRSQVAIPLISLVNAKDRTAKSAVDDAVAMTRFDLVRKAAATLKESIDRNSRDAVNSRSDALIALYVALCVSVALIAGAGLGAWRGLHRWVLAPVDRLALQTREVAAGRNRRPIRPSGPPELRALGRDVERMRRRIADELARLAHTGEELSRSNADLEQFAYVASHDLSEPLRKVANFCQLLERQYGDQLDDRAREYIAYAVDGAKRMQALIADLLTLSRVGRTTESFVPVDMNQALAIAMRTLDDQIVASDGGVGFSELPVVYGDPTLLASLFENLVGNAIKYRGDAAPLVTVTAVADRENRTWTFTVADNGIGIDPQYAQRIFAIFQRLHVRDAYPGTGIGLALCRKIVEFHGGRIWLDTSVSSGATFRFTLPERPTT
ncbi:MAG TPA: ATP-binding protein [Jatrophihabitantaceae bacterium]|jgi:signal transduction histidine kinase|nr:ATP-binding protein [Jatrophihabitantaceae bacterium]